MTPSGVVSAKENVLIESGDCSVTILPHFGGKIASIRFRNHELLHPPLNAIGPRTPTMPFDAADASGWDECLPSVAACEIRSASGITAVPDHGDLWRVPWSVTSLNSQSARLTGTCFSLPLTLERTLALTDGPAGVKIDLHYKLTNTGNTSVPWSWAAHPLLVSAPGDRIVLPDSIRSLRLESSNGNRLGRRGDRVEWPIAALFDGSQADLSLAQAAQSGIGDKLFAGPLAASENWCALERASAKVRIRVSFDPLLTPYLGLWICYGGWPERPGPKQACVALEPSTAPVDSLAISGPWSRTLAPGESSIWPMQVDFETM